MNSLSSINIISITLMFVVVAKDKLNEEGSYVTK